MNQPDNVERLIEIKAAIAQRSPIGATVVHNANGTKDISIPNPIERTLELYREAVVLYPYNVDLRLDFSFSLLQAGQQESAIDVPPVSPHTCCAPWWERWRTGDVEPNVGHVEPNVGHVEPDVGHVEPDGGKPRLPRLRTRYHRRTYAALY